MTMQIRKWVCGVGHNIVVLNEDNSLQNIFSIELTQS